MEDVRWKWKADFVLAGQFGLARLCRKIVSPDLSRT